MKAYQIATHVTCILFAILGVIVFNYLFPYLFSDEWILQNMSAKAEKIFSIVWCAFGASFGYSISAVSIAAGFLGHVANRRYREKLELEDHLID